MNENNDVKISKNTERIGQLEKKVDKLELDTVNATKETINEKNRILEELVKRFWDVSKEKAITLIDLNLLVGSNLESILRFTKSHDATDSKKWDFWVWETGMQASIENICAKNQQVDRPVRTRVCVQEGTADVDGTCFVGCSYVHFCPKCGSLNCDYDDSLVCHECGALIWRYEQ